MPGRNGKDVYYSARNAKPDVKILFCSGHNDGIITNNGFAATTVLCLKKPVEQLFL